MKDVEYFYNKASEAEIIQHLQLCDMNFFPPLSERVEIIDYARKIADKATRFEVWSDSLLVGLVAAYCNDKKSSIAYITSVSILKEWMGQGLAARLLQQCITYVKGIGIQKIRLEVASDNVRAITLYEKNGFLVDKATARKIMVSMNLYLNTK